MKVKSMGCAQLLEYNNVTVSSDYSGTYLFKPTEMCIKDTLICPNNSLYY